MNNSPVEVLTQKDIAPEGLHQRINEVTEKMLAMPQAEASVIHRFSPGLYIREVSLKAGSFIIGYIHKHDHFNIMLKGHLIMINEDGSITDFIAPQSYTAKPGRKVVYIVEDTVWQNIYPTDETDIDKIEEMFLDKGADAPLTDEQLANTSRAEFEADRFDYSYMLANNGLTEEFVREIAEREDDLIPMPGNVHPYRIGISLIEGKGYFLTVGAKAGVLLAPARIGDMRTNAGRFVNHSRSPNAEMRKGPDNTIYLVAIKNIDGCMGGSIGTEVTTDYQRTMNLLGLTGDKICRQYIQA